MAKINENIRNLRKALGITQEEVGKRIGVSKQTIQRYESGEISNIPYDKIISLSKALSVTPAEIMGFNVPESNGLNVQSANEDVELLKKYHLLSEKQKQMVNDLIDSYL